MSAFVQLYIVASVCVLGILIALLISQDRTIAQQKKAIDAMSRAESRQRARAELLFSDLKHLSHSAQVITLWRPRQPNVSRKETP